MRMNSVTTSNSRRLKCVMLCLGITVGCEGTSAGTQSAHNSPTWNQEHSTKSGRPGRSEIHPRSAVPAQSTLPGISYTQMQTPTTDSRPPATASVAPATTQGPQDEEQQLSVGYGTPVREHSQTGRASWYTWRAGNCASRDIPRGVSVVVRRLSTGATARCTVGDYGPTKATGRIIDLDSTIFSQLAPLSEGVIEVTVLW